MGYFGSPENKAIANIEREISKKQLDAVYEKADGKIKDEQINPDDFADIVGKEKISKDKKYVENMESVFAKEADPNQEESRKLATILEAVLHEHSELSEWLGPNSFTAKASRYDDIKNGVDTIAEFEDEDSGKIEVLAIDITTSQDLSKKIGRIKKEIESGEMAKIDYFSSQHTDTRQSLKNIPRIIIGADKRTVSEIGNLWVKGENNALGEHNIQFQIIEEMILQCVKFKEYAEKFGKSDIASKYQKLNEILRKVYDEKKSGGVEDDHERDRDRVFAELKKEISEIS